MNVLRTNHSSYFKIFSAILGELSKYIFSLIQPKFEIIQVDKMHINFRFPSFAVNEWLYSWIKEVNAIRLLIGS